MRIRVTHPIGAELSVQGSRRRATSVFVQWWNSCIDIAESIPPERAEPDKQGAEALAQHAGTRFFESEGLYQDVPIVQAHAPLGFSANPSHETPHHLASERNAT